MNKRGLSDVVTNVLLILVVIVSVSIIAAVVISLTRQTTTGIGSECLTLNLEVASCNAGTNTVTVKRNSGRGEFDNLVVIQESGNPFEPSPAISSASLSELGTSAGIITTDDIVSGEEVNVGVKLPNGQTCEPLNPSLVCP